ncbi:MAG: DUF5723 family protein [Bacteroidales bacterium]|nr:DUF5723 family protein [Bacteroidales bacterium]
MSKIIFKAIFILCFTSIYGQQNNLLYFAPEVPQANLLNPAYQIPCKWFIGLPVLSSMHVNYGNSAFSVNNLASVSGETASLDPNSFLRGIKRRNSIGTEVHVMLLGLGYRRNDWYYNFSIIEKNEANVFLPRSMFDFVWSGNGGNIGETIKINNIGAYGHHIREYALGASTILDNGMYVGAKAKLLFGKLNATSRGSRASLSTADHTYNLLANYNLDISTSLPITVSTTPDNNIENVTYNDGTDIKQLILNRKNKGFAIDAGIMYPYSDKITLSASIIDLGFVNWRSNLNSLQSDTEVRFEGIDTISDNPLDSYEDYQDMITFDIGQNNYSTWLPTKLHLGGEYDINKYFIAGALITSKFYAQKWLTSLTFTGSYLPTHWSRIMLGYNMQYGSYNNIGLGLTVGKNPVQFYAYTDNLVGIIKPMNTRNLNMRFGLNIIVGCKQKNEKEIRGAKKSGSQVPCPNINLRKNKTKERIERKGR